MGSAIAQDQPDRKRPFGDLPLRSNYENSPDLPDGVVFWSVMNHVEAMRTRDTAFAIAWVQGEMGLPQPDAEQFLGQLTATYEAYSSEYMKVSRKLACSVDASRAPRHEIFPILEKLDDSTYTLASKHLMQLKATVGKDVAARLQQALDTAKLNTSHTTFDHKAVYEKKGGNPELTVAGICERLSTLAQQEGE